MKRNTFGINVDEGIALTTDEEFDQLFVDVDSEAAVKLEAWMKTGRLSALFGGQIGCGKTTLIEYIFKKTGCLPDITFHFDRGSLNLSSIDAWSIVFTGLFKYIAEMSHESIPLIPKDFCGIIGNNPEAILQSVSQIRLESFSTEAREKNRRFSDLLNSIESDLSSFFETIVADLESKRTTPLFFFASGIDKFEPGTTAFYALREVVYPLSEEKTLFEANAVHLFLNEPLMMAADKIYLAAWDTPQIVEMLKKRLGGYANAYDKELPLIAEFSAGMPRQALRLLDSFLAHRKKAANFTEAFTQAVAQSNRDFFAFAPRPEQDLMAAVSKKEMLETSLVGVPGDSATAKRAVFGNWIVLKSPAAESWWKASINPLIKDTFVKVTPEEPERVLLREYAQQQGMSDFGLDVRVDSFKGNQILQDQLETPIAHRILQDQLETPIAHQILLGQLETPIALNVTEILDAISSALLSVNRSDRVIVAYEDKAIAGVVRAYFAANSNAYEYQTWKHHSLRGDSEISPLFQLMEIFSENAADIISLDFVGDFSQESLDELNVRRDSFLDRQLIWWIPKDKLNTYLARWTQLRQLFQVFVLEEDLRRSLSVEEIEADLDFMAELVDSEGTAPFSYVQNLKVVLAYLKGVNHG
ncbi:hypothetical protein [Desulfoluna sp.]|uniref:hypothetical protein n=1 Tax=Desulfoluna sp. TaxID=2045199 RepID=UPI002612D82A|nr:hypothetical protein [Desulfoluna sp.]